jgi:hypothetical protein
LKRGLTEIVSSQPDRTLRLASPGIRGLSKIGASNNSMWALVPNDARAGIVQNYRQLVTTGAMTGNPALESALGIQ